MNNKLKLVSLTSAVVIVIAFALLFIPGSYIGVFQETGSLFPGVGTSLGGYQFIFHIVSEIAKDIPNPYFGMGHVCGTGLTALIFMVMSLAAFIFYKKSTALPLLGGILNVISGFFFLMTTPFSHLIYKKDYMYAMWVPYLIGTLIALCGILAIYVSIVELKKEKATLMSKGGYSYLKK